MLKLVKRLNPNLTTSCLIIKLISTVSVGLKSTSTLFLDFKRQNPYLRPRLNLISNRNLCSSLSNLQMDLQLLQLSDLFLEGDKALEE
jgi:hypothetical protein